MNKARGISILFALACAVAVAACGDNSIDSRGECSLCVQNVPVGPSASQEACEAWGDDFDCADAVLTDEGMCGTPMATCTVTGCTMEVTLCTLPD